MRIVIAGPPKAGNVWLKCILGTIYDLKALGPQAVPERPRLDLFKEWIAGGGFADGTIFHQHYDYSDELAEAMRAVPAHIVTIVRDPYDVFVSSYFTLQQYQDGDGRRGKRDQLKGKPLDHPDVLAYLQRGGFRNNMLKANQWMHSGHAAVVRYEELHGDPVGALRRLTAGIAPVPDERIEQAVEACSAENMRKSNRTSKHVRAAKVGDSKERLTEEHLAIFRDQHADLIRSLGYEVR